MEMQEKSFEGKIDQSTEAITKIAPVLILSFFSWKFPDNNGPNYQTVFRHSWSVLNT